MRKITIALLAFFISSNVARATILKLGPRVGGSISHLNVNLSKGSQDYKDLSLKAGKGYHLGIFTRFQLASIYIQPEFLISGSGALFNKENRETDLHFTKLDLPAVVGLSCFKIVRMQVGPVLSALLNALEDDKSIKKHYNNVTVGWQAGLGIDIANLIIDLKYEGSLSVFGKKIGSLNAKHGYGVWMFSLGFNIL